MIQHLRKRNACGGAFVFILFKLSLFDKREAVVLFKIAIEKNHHLIYNIVCSG